MSKVPPHMGSVLDGENYLQKALHSPELQVSFPVVSSSILDPGVA